MKTTKASLDQIKSKILPVLKEAGVTHSALFGSYVRGEATEESDIDLLVEVLEDTGLFAYIALQRKLEEALSKKVDLVTYKSLHPLLRDKILKEQHPVL
jgi:predicted nucleotidyltransferase